MSFKTLSEAVIRLGHDVMGETVYYTPSTTDPVAIKGVFKNEWIEVEGIVSFKPTLRIQLSVLAAPPDKGDVVTIGDIDYRVMRSHEDGHGGTTLILQKA
jgi:hypothetical protein